MCVLAQRRMISPKITDTDIFLDMPLSAQALYFHLNIHADDDGFVDNVKTIQRMVGSSEDDAKLLIAKQFIIPFDNPGIVVIKDWRIHNYIRKDRYIPTMHKEEADQLDFDENGSYQKKPKPLSNNVLKAGIPVVDQLSTNGIPTGDVGKVRLGKVRLGKSNTMSGSDEPDQSVTLATKSLIEQINKLSGSRYRATSTWKRLVGARLKDYSLEELTDMVNFVWKEWEDWNERNKYFRPKTLFAASKADEYMGKMNAQPSQVDSNQDWLREISE